MKILLLTLLLVTSAIAGTDQQLTLYFVPSPKGIDWSTPSNLAISALKNKISMEPRFMGHVFVELTCGNKHELTGMTSKSFDYLNQLLVEQRGLGILYHSFEGKLEDKESIQTELSGYLRTGYVNFTRFILNEKQCNRALSYLDEYRKNDVGRFYGLANRPRFGEGAGCSAFGVSFPDVLDILDHEMKEAWSQTVNIPLEYAGPPLTEEGVGLIKVILNAGSWASEKEKHKKLTFWSPDRMHEWVKNKVKNPGQGVAVLQIENTRGLIIDKSHFPVPEGPIWLQKIDPNDSKKTVEIQE
ncbi:MAG: hypothetical protein ACLGHN_13265 [Bacteriovoracia bacterium]